MAIDSWKQLTLFGKQAAHSAEKHTLPKKTTASHSWWLYTDGASRDNPGISGAGYYILKDGIPYYQDGYSIGTRTNNQAEYIALLCGTIMLQQWIDQQDTVSIFSDSQLLVRQINGIYKVKNELLKPLFQVAQHMIKSIRAQVHYIPREENRDADRMANLGIDTKKSVPEVCIKILHQYEIDL